jgi:hypothetical protein
MGPLPLAKTPRHSGTADASLDREAIFLQFPGDPRGGAMLGVGQFGVLVQILVESLLARLDAFVTSQDRVNTGHDHGIRSSVHFGASFA